MTIDLSKNSMEVHQNWNEPWRITLVDTGAETQTGGRLRAVRGYLIGGEPFCFTDGDGVSSVDVMRKIAFHKEHGRKATIAVVTPPGRFDFLRDKQLLEEYWQKGAPWKTW